MHVKTKISPYRVDCSRLFFIPGDLDLSVNMSPIRNVVLYGSDLRIIFSDNEKIKIHNNEIVVDGFVGELFYCSISQGIFKFKYPEDEFEFNCAEFETIEDVGPLIDFLRFRKDKDNLIYLDQWDEFISRDQKLEVLKDIASDYFADRPSVKFMHISELPDGILRKIDSAAKNLYMAMSDEIATGSEKFLFFSGQTLLIKKAYDCIEENKDQLTFAKGLMRVKRKGSDELFSIPLLSATLNVEIPSPYVLKFNIDDMYNIDDFCAINKYITFDRLYVKNELMGKLKSLAVTENLVDIVMSNPVKIKTKGVMWGGEVDIEIDWTPFVYVKNNYRWRDYIYLRQNVYKHTPNKVKNVETRKVEYDYDEMSSYDRKNYQDVMNTYNVLPGCYGMGKRR